MNASRRALLGGISALVATAAHGQVFRSRGYPGWKSGLQFFGASNPTPLYDQDISTTGHYTNTGGKLSAMTNQGTFPGGMTQATVANQLTLTTGGSGQFAIGNGSSTIIAYPTLAAYPQTSAIQLPDARGGGNDPARSPYPNWSAGTTYPARAAPGFVTSLVDGKPYYSIVAGNIGNEPSVSPASWTQVNPSGWSTTHINRNLAKGSGYVIGNDGRRCQGDGDPQWPGAVFVTEAGAKDTAYGNGVGFYAGEFLLPLPAFTGLSVQGVAINPDDTGYLWLAIEATGIVEFNYTTGVQRGTILTVDGLNNVNGMTVLGDSNPLGNGCYFITMGDGATVDARTITMRTKAGNLISAHDTGTAYDGIWWDIVSRNVFCMGGSTCHSYTAYGLSTGTYPAQSNTGGAPVNWSTANANVPTTFNRGEGVCIAWDGVTMLNTHNGPYHQSGTPTASPNYGLLSKSTFVGGALSDDTPCLDVFIRLSSTTWSNSKTLIQGGDPVQTTFGWGVWQDSTASNNLRVYACPYATSQNAKFNTGTITTASFPAGKVIQVSYNGPGQSVSVYLDNVLISTDTTTFTDFFAAQRIQKGMLAIGGSPLDAVARNSTINYKGSRVYATATGISSALQASTVAYLQGLA